MNAARAALQNSMGSGGGGPASTFIGLIAGAGTLGIIGKLPREHRIKKRERSIGI